MPELLIASPLAPFPHVFGEATRAVAADFLKSTCGLHYQEQTKNTEEVAGIMATISFGGQQSWALSLVLPNHTAEALAESFAGFPILRDSPDMGDVIGEIVNVIAGGICARLAAQGINAQMSLPTVVRGEDVSVLAQSGAATKWIGFSGAIGTCSFKLVTARVFEPGHHPF